MCNHYLCQQRVPLIRRCLWIRLDVYCTLCTHKQLQWFLTTVYNVLSFTAAVTKAGLFRFSDCAVDELPSLLPWNVPWLVSLFGASECTNWIHENKCVEQCCWRERGEGHQKCAASWWGFSSSFLSTLGRAFHISAADCLKGTVQRFL